MLKSYCKMPPVKRCGAPSPVVLYTTVALTSVTFWGLGGLPGGRAASSWLVREPMYGRPTCGRWRGGKGQA